MKPSIWYAEKFCLALDGEHGEDVLGSLNRTNVQIEAHRLRVHVWEIGCERNRVQHLGMGRDACAQQCTGATAQHTDQKV